MKTLTSCDQIKEALITASNLTAKIEAANELFIQGGGKTLDLAGAWPHVLLEANKLRQKLGLDES